jgi:hypothetical protein
MPARKGVLPVSIEEIKEIALSLIEAHDARDPV